MLITVTSAASRCTSPSVPAMCSGGDGWSSSPPPINEDDGCDEAGAARAPRLPASVSDAGGGAQVAVARSSDASGGKPVKGWCAAGSSAAPWMLAEGVPAVIAMAVRSVERCSLAVGGAGTAPLSSGGWRRAAVVAATPPPTRTPASARACTAPLAVTRPRQRAAASASSRRAPGARKARGRTGSCRTRAAALCRVSCAQPTSEPVAVAPCVVQRSSAARDGAASWSASWCEPGGLRCAERRSRATDRGDGCHMAGARKVPGASPAACAGC